MSTTKTVRLEDDVKDYPAAETVRAQVENNEWQVSTIRTALKEADAGDFAEEKAVTALATKWKVRAS